MSIVKHLNGRHNIGFSSADMKAALAEVCEMRQSAMAALEQQRQSFAAVQAELAQAAGQQPEHNIPADQPSSSHCDADIAAQPTKHNAAGCANGDAADRLSRRDAATAQTSSQDEAGCTHAKTAAPYGGQDAGTRHPSDQEEAGPAAHADAAAIFSRQDADIAQRSDQDEAGCSHDDAAATSSENGPRVQQRLDCRRRKRDAHDDGEGTSTQQTLFCVHVAGGCCDLIPLHRRGGEETIGVVGWGKEGWGGMQINTHSLCTCKCIPSHN